MILYGQIFEKIRTLPKNNKYRIRLNVLEFQQNNKHITEEQAVEKATKLVMDFMSYRYKRNGKKVKLPDVSLILAESEMYAGIDTIQIATDKEIEEEIIKQKDYVHNSKKKCLKNGKWQYVVNPDKFNNNIGIYCASEYTRVFDEMMFDLELTSHDYSRIDFRFDFFDNDMFDKLWKLNSVLIALFSKKYEVKNRYASTDIISCERLTLRVQTQYLQIEYYHKYVQEDTSKINARLELRSCKLGSNTNELNEFEKWKSKLLKILDKEIYKTLQEEKNNRLFEIWQKEKAIYKNMNVYEFLSKYVDHIYTQEQLSDFFKRLGYKAPDKAASTYKRSKGFESISMNLLTEYVNKIIASGERFFES